MESCTEKIYIKKTRQTKRQRLHERMQNKSIQQCVKKEKESNEFKQVKLESPFNDDYDESNKRDDESAEEDNE